MDNVLLFLANLMVSLYRPLYIAALVISFVFVISGTMDLFIDLSSMVWRLRRLFIRKKIHPLTMERLEAREQQRIAIFIAAWHESDVIARTLENACETIQYKNYDIFVGTYPNDPDTQREVDKVAKINRHVHKVITPDMGPTNKASNLNHVFNALLNYEQKTGNYFDIIAMHDSEDVIHPLSLLVYNYLIPRIEMVQIPVFPVPQPLRRITHWTYADEFAENHTKVLRVRELNQGFVPSAGVGTAFTKRAFQLLALEHQEVFSPNTLTEDYQLGLRMNMHGMKAAFVNIKRPPSEKSKDKNGGPDWIATRALFPTDFKRAVKQKTRWNIGIILQGWENIGWKGPLPVKWDLLQDRKGLITAPVNFLAYFIFVYFLLYQLVSRLSGVQMPVLIPDGSLLAKLVLISSIYMVWRLSNRAIAVDKVYGFLPAITSIPRTIWGNIINFFSISRAIYQYFLNKFKKQTVAWDKTAHELPADVADSSPAKTKKETGKVNDLQHLSEILPKKNYERMFARRLNSADKREKIKLLESVPKSNCQMVFPHFIRYISDPDWEIRAAVCRSLSFLQIPQGIPYLKRAACDQDWVVRGNAVRALGKLGDQGEKALMSLLENKDKYARDAARTILEQQGFFDRYLARLTVDKTKASNHAKLFFVKLAKVGNSEIAWEIVRKYNLEAYFSQIKTYEVPTQHHENLIQSINSLDA
jgi:adsorption protein B